MPEPLPAPDSAPDPATGGASSPATAAPDVLASPPPPVTEAEAERLGLALFGIRGRAGNLASERDTNFRLTAADGRSYALKFANPAEPAAHTNLQTEALLTLQATDPGLPVPKVVRGRDGRAEIPVVLTDGRTSLVRLLTWVEGEQVVKVGVSAALCADIGRTLARLGAGLAGFRHPAAGLTILWDIKNAAQLRPLLPTIPDPAVRSHVAAAVDRFDRRVAPRLPGLRRQVVHNDLNHHNIVVRPDAPDRVAGVLDFGDIVETALAIDVAVAASYLTSLPDLPGLPSGPLAPVCRFLAAYHAVTPLTRDEIGLMRDLILTRLATSIAITSWRAHRYPLNAAYILRNNGPARLGMARFATLDPGAVTATFLSACDME